MTSTWNWKLALIMETKSLWVLGSTAGQGSTESGLCTQGWGSGHGCATDRFSRLVSDSHKVGINCRTMSRSTGNPLCIAPCRRKRGSPWNPYLKKCFLVKIPRPVQMQMLSVGDHPMMATQWHPSLNQFLTLGPGMMGAHSQRQGRQNGVFGHSWPIHLPQAVGVLSKLTLHEPEASCLRPQRGMMWREGREESQWGKELGWQAGEGLSKEEALRGERP